MAEIKGAERSVIVVLKWKDKRDVLMLTAKHSPETVEVSEKNGIKMKSKAVV